MDNATNIALSYLVAQTRAMDVTAMNLANVTAPGYRAERMLFSDWLSRQHGGTPPGGSTIVFPQDRATYRDRKAGTLSPTANPLDLAITGDGYFTVQAPGGPRLTRGGHFSLAQDGKMVDGDGYPLLDTAGQPVQLTPADPDIKVASDGTVSSENGQIGKIGVVSPSDPNKLMAEGNRLMNATATTTAPVAAPQLIQGSIEASNVEPTSEVTRMMNDLRTFQMVSQFIQTEADRQQGAIDKIIQQRS